MLSIADSLFRPSVRYANESFEGWAYRRGLLRHIQRLEADAFLERQPGGSADRVYRLTPKGRLAALGGKDPEQLWNRGWDGKWRLLMFDLPASPQRPRARLRSVLRERGFGCLQHSVWISPDSTDALKAELAGERHPASLILFEGNPAGGEKPGDIVDEAWDFAAVARAWEQLDLRLAQGRSFIGATAVNGEELRAWMRAEQGDWMQVVEIDPFLPQTLLPKNYPGRKVWKRRVDLWQRLAERLSRHGFPPAKTDKK